jgi:alpha-tubulin suppressor-like RCC1 family protein
MPSASSIYTTAYTGGVPITGFENIGNIAVDVTGNGNTTLGNFVSGIPVQYDSSGYVIISDTTTAGLVDRTTGNNTGTASANTPTFWVSNAKDDPSFLNLTNRLPQRYNLSPFIDTPSAKSWLNDNGYWTSYIAAIQAAFIQIAAANHNSSSFASFGLQSNGKLWSWGFNNAGELGDNTLIQKNTPVAVCSTQSFTFVTGGGNSGGAIDNLGKAWSWGSQAGDNTVNSRSTPVAVCGGHIVTFMSFGSGHRVMINSSGQAWCWGSGTSGQLGSADSVNKFGLNRSTPVAVCGGKIFTYASAGFQFTVALTATGSAWSWGLGSAPLGVIRGNATHPVAVCGVNVFSTVAAGFNSAGGINSSGQSYTWGTNLSGQLGLGTTASSSTPVAVSGGQVFSKISIGNSFTVALNTSGQAYSWGLNSSGQLGDNTISNRCLPVPVCGNKTFTSIAAGWAAVVALDTTGQSWTWGANGGNLGNNTTNPSSTPVAVCPII